MALGNGLRIIWLDSHIGLLGVCSSLKERFRSTIQPITAMPPNGIDELICTLDRDIAPIEYVSNIDDALALIQYEKDKRIILISSGTLGKEIIPMIVSNYSRVFRFYIFCLHSKALMKWGLEQDYENIMKVYNHESALLVDLSRDMSEDIIKLGQTFMDLRDGEAARKCFVVAQTLETHANNVNASYNYTPFRKRLDILEGPHGLIQQARDLDEEKN